MDKQGPIVVACDSFKGSLNAHDVCEAVRHGIVMATGSRREVICLPMADGGEGTAEILTKALKGTIVTVDTLDPLLRPIKASYGLLPDKVAVIELAAASGLPLLENSMRNPEKTSTFGTGLLIKDALQRGCRKIPLCLGGSATNDAATGLLAALGVIFKDSKGRVITSLCGATLGEINYMEIPEQLKNVEFTLACDVTNLFYGEKGATAVFAPQKGADAAMVRRLEKGMRSLASVIQKISGFNVQNMAGSGAAGGAAGSLAALLGAKIQPGAAMVAETLRLKEAMKSASLTITGEGKIDAQTIDGKAPMAVLHAAAENGVPVIAIAGRVEAREELLQAGFSELIEISDRSMELQEAMKPAVTKLNIARRVCGYLETHRDTHGPMI